MMKSNKIIKLILYIYLSNGPQLNYNNQTHY